MARKKLELALPTVDDLFTSQGEREQDAGEKVREIALEAIEAFPGHPFRWPTTRTWPAWPRASRRAGCSSP